MKREGGFYWCKNKHEPQSWFVCLYVNGEWYIPGLRTATATDDFFIEINETRLLPPLNT